MLKVSLVLQDFRYILQLSFDQIKNKGFWVTNGNRAE